MADEEGRVNGEVELKGTDLEDEGTENATTPKESEESERRANEEEEIAKLEDESEVQSEDNTGAGEGAAKGEEATNVDKHEVEEDISVEEKKDDQQDIVHVTNGEEVEERRQETEVVTETRENQKVTTSESSHIESSVETTAPVQIAPEEAETRADQSEEIKEQTKKTATQSEGTEEPQSEPEPQPEPQPKEKQNEKPADSEVKVEEAKAEISEPGIKAQLKEIIKEIDDTVANEDVAQELTEEEQEEGQEQREDVVPIDVADVPEPPPVEQLPPPSSTDAQESGDDTSRMQYQEHIGPIMVPQLLPNGELGSLIEIPEGIPLLARILPKEEGSDREKIPLERLFTPATDSGEITPRKKKAFASSDFYAPNHPTIDDQLQLAQNISKSLIDQNNKTSRGQAMYEKRKQRSVKWIHQEGGKLVQQEVEEEEEEAQGTEFLETSDVQPKTSKPAMKLVMNPKGVQDHTTVEQHYQQLLEQSNMSSSNMSPGMPASPEMVRDIITDMQSPTGKGAALFAKRKKRMDKFIVDETNVQKSSAYQQDQQSFVQNTTTEKSTVNQFSSFSSSSSSSSTSQQKTGVLASSIPASNKKKSLQARDEEQQRIMAEFLKNRESQFQIVKTPWEAVLETGNTSAAFKQNLQTKSSFSSTISAVSGPALPGGGVAPPPWLEMPQPVPVTAPLPKSTSSAPLPTPPSPFAAYTAGPAANGPLNNPTTLPDLSTILTSSSAKSKSLTPQPSSTNAAVKPSGLNVKPALALDNNRASNLLSKSTTRSPRSSSVGKPQEKRLSTLPNAAKYPFPSYLNIASKPTGYLRSSSASSIAALAEAFANDSSMAAKSTDDLSETFPFLKPGTPPIVVVPGVEGESTSLGNGLPNEIPSWIAQVETKKVAKQQPPDFTSEVKLRKVKSREATSRIASGGVNSVEAQNEGVGGTGLVYTAEVKVVQPSGQPKSQVFQPSAAPAPFTPLAPLGKPAAPDVPLSQPIFTAPAATKPVVTKPVPSPGGLGCPPAQGSGFVSQAEAEERRKSMNFNLAANGWGNYNKYYRPISFAS